MSDLAARLRVLGLTPREAEAYLDVLFNGETGASDVGARLGIDRADASRLLASLAQRGVLETTLTKPARYKAVSPDALFDLAVHQAEASMLAIHEARRHVAGEISRRGNPESRARVQKFAYGRLECNAEFNALLDGARREALIVSTRPHPTRRRQSLHTEMMAKTVLRLLQRDIHVSIILTIEPSNEEAVRQICDAGATVKHLTTSRRIQAALVDGERAVIWKLIDPSEYVDAKGDVAVVTNAEALVGGYTVLFHTLWDAGEHAFSDTEEDPPDDSAHHDGADA